MTPYRRIRGFLIRHRGAYALGILALLVTDLAGIYATYVKTDILARLERLLGVGGADPGVRWKLAVLCAVFFGAMLLHAAGRYGWRIFFLTASHRIARDLRMTLYGKLGRLPLPFFHRTPTGDIMSRGTNDLDAIRMMLGPGVLVAVDTIFYLAVVPPLLYVTSPHLSLWIFMMLPVFYVVVRHFQGRVESRWTEVQAQLSVLSVRVQENTAGVRVVKAYGQEEAECRGFDRLLDDTFDKQVALNRVQSVFNPLLVALARSGIAIILGFGGMLFFQGRIGFAELVRFLFFLDLLVWPMMGLGHAIALFQQGAVSLRRLNQILNEEEEERASSAEYKPANDLPALRAITPTGAARQAGEPRTTSHEKNPVSIEFRHLTFAYPGARWPVLSGVSVSLPPHSIMAFVGPVGSGKSTLAHLVARLYEPPRGTVFVGGRDVCDIPLQELRRAVGFVPQNPFLFSDTVRENIAFFDPAGIPHSDVVWAAHAAQFAEEVERLPKQYEQMLGERGVNLSGGQRQRATIARALLVRPQILILDDCLASVDLETEHRILKELHPLLKQTTCLWVTHRVLSTRTADLIVVLEAGRVVEQGSFETLARSGGIFAQMVRRQMAEQKGDAHERVR